MTSQKDLSIDFLGVRCENPFFLSPHARSDYGTLAAAFGTGWGGAVCRIAGQPQDTSPDTLQRLKRDFPNKTLIVSITGKSDEEWRTRAQTAADSGADIIECAFPSRTADFKEDSGTDTIERTAHHTGTVCRAVSLPVLARLMPDHGHTGQHATAAIRAGAKGIAAACPAGTVSAEPQTAGSTALSVSRRPCVLAKPAALDFITRLKQHPGLKDIPISGMGGAVTWRDALDFLYAGASIVRIMAAAREYGQRIIEDLTDGLSHHMAEKGTARLSGLVGHPPANIVPAGRKHDMRFTPEIDQFRCIGCGRCYIACRDSGHHAIDWDDYTRTPAVNEHCAQCNLCLDTCPVPGCITPRQNGLWASGLSIPLIVPTD